MNKVVIYTSKTCPYCVKAKKLLQMLNLEYEEKNTDDDFEGMCEDLSLEFGKQIQTVPQIIINGNHIGGYSDLEAAHKNGRLKTILQ